VSASDYRSYQVITGGTPSIRETTQHYIIIMSIKEDTLTGAPETTDEYDAMIQVLDTLISEGLRKFVGDGRLRDMEKEEKRLEYMKRTEQVIRAKREVVKDKQLQEMGRTLEALQESNDLDLNLSN